MLESQITVTAAERQCLMEILERALKEMRVEEHRTRAPSYREHLVEHEQCIERLLDKLRQSASSA